MPQGTVSEHKSGRVQLTIPFDASVSDFKFYSSNIGGGSVSQMVFRKSVSAPAELPPGFHSFDLTDTELGIANPERVWHVHITQVVSGLESSLLGEPRTVVPASTSDAKAEKQSTTNLNFDGTAGKGLWDFGQKSRITIRRISADFVSGAAFKLSIVDADGDEHTILENDSGTTKSLLVTDEVILEKGEKIKLVTTGGAPESYRAKVNRK